LALGEQVKRMMDLSGAGALNFEFRRESAIAEKQEAAGQDLDFTCTILVLGKTGVGKSATCFTDAFELGTEEVQEIIGTVEGIKIRDTDHYGDLLLLRTITETFSPAVWLNTIVALTHAASPPPDGANGDPLDYDMFVAQRSNVMQQDIRQASGDMELETPQDLYSSLKTHQWPLVKGFYLCPILLSRLLKSRAPPEILKPKLVRLNRGRAGNLVRDIIRPPFYSDNYPWHRYRNPRTITFIANASRRPRYYPAPTPWIVRPCSGS
ncbi:hypothetical protein KI387_041632, partial [Taxus chinensis]